MATVDIPVEIKQVDFQQAAGTAYSRPRTDIRHTGQRLARQPEHLHRKYPFNRRCRAVQKNIGRRKSDGTATLVTMRHPATHPVGSPQQGLRHSQVTGIQRLADARAAHTAPADRKGMHVDDRKTMHRARLFKQGIIAGTVLAEAEIIADNQVFHTQALKQDDTDKIIRLQTGKIVAKTQADKPVHAKPPQCFHLLPETRQARWYRARAEVLARLRFKRNDRYR